MCHECLKYNVLKESFVVFTGRFTKLYSGGLTCPEDLKQYILRDHTGYYYCGYCHNFSNRSSTNVRNHCEAKHFPNTFTYSCKLCDMQFGTNTSLYNHMARSHKKDIKWRFFCLNQRGLYAQVLCRLRRILRVISAKMIWAGSIRVLSATMRIGTREMSEITLRADTFPTCLSTLASFAGMCLAQKHNWTTILPEVTRSYTCSRLGQNNSFNTFSLLRRRRSPEKPCEERRDK